MAPEEIKALRQKLGCTARQLAQALGVEGAEVVAWEGGARFPTKRLVGKLMELRERGLLLGQAPSKKEHSPSRREVTTSAPPPSLEALQNPKLWSVVKKLVEDPAFLEEVAELLDSPKGRKG